MAPLIAKIYAVTSTLNDRIFITSYGVGGKLDLIKHRQAMNDINFPESFDLDDVCEEFLIDVYQGEDVQAIKQEFAAFFKADAVY